MTRRIPENITLYAAFGAGQGYSGMSEQFGIHMNHFSDVRVARFADTPIENLDAETLDLLAKPYQRSDIALTIGFPASFSTATHLNHKFRAAYTMFETDKLPVGVNDWNGAEGNPADAINKHCDLLFVPCEDNVATFRRAGVTVPIEVVPNGIHKMYQPMKRLPRPADHKFTFLIMGTLSIRKNSGAVVSAFIDNFKDTPDVRLILKTQSGTHGHMEFDKAVGDIQIIDALYTRQQMLDLMQEADCFVFPSHGEGFGLPPIEAAATGLPTIIANNTGMKEYANREYFYVISSDEKQPASHYPKKWGDVGNWYQPSYDELKEVMRYIYDHQASAAMKGLRSSSYVHEKFDYDTLSKYMLEKIAEYADKVV